MHVEYVYADNTRFLLSIAASSTYHQIKLVISCYEALIKRFPMLDIAPNFGDTTIPRGDSRSTSIKDQLVDNSLVSRPM